MKKILLSIGFCLTVFAGKSQIVFNEFYTDPGGGESEFIELYNQGGATENLDGYVAVLFYEVGATKGFYVLDMPAIDVLSKHVFVAGRVIPFNYQAGTYTGPADSSFAWDNLNAYPGTKYLLNYQVDNAGTDYVSPSIPANTNDILVTLSGSTKFQVFLFKNGSIVNGLSCNGPESILASVRSCPNLSLPDPDGAGPASAFTIIWNSVGTSVEDNRIEYANAAAGSGNGYKRLRDGQCGAWIKSSSQNNHTPGKLNGSASDANDVLSVIANFSPCLTANQGIDVNYWITGGPASAFPVTVTVWEDLGTTDNPASQYVHEQWLPNLSTAGDQILRVDAPVPSTTLPSPSVNYTVSPTIRPEAYDFQYSGPKDARRIYLVFATPAGCFDQIREATACAILPVDFKSFTATRNRSSVVLKWETASEKNNSGFAVERNNNGTWEQIAFVNSQAAGGNSDALLSYTYNDLNNSKGITQYRIKQVDLDNKSKYSEIRSVRGLDQIGKVTVYPNPTSNGTVNVVFDDASVNRTISVIDMSGRTLKQINNVSTNNITIDNLQPGMYTLRIMVPETGEQNVHKIVVNKR